MLKRIKICKDCKYFRPYGFGSSPCPFNSFRPEVGMYKQLFNSKWNNLKDFCSKYESRDNKFLEGPVVEESTIQDKLSLIDL